MSTYPLPDATMMTRLQDMRARARRLLAVHGLLVIGTSGLSMILLLVMLDWLLWFPGGMRLVFCLLWLMVVGWQLYKRVLRPLRFEYSILHIATKIEEQFPEFEDRLTSSVSFMQGADGTLDALQQKLIERTETIAERVPIEQAITRSHVWHMVAACAAPLLVTILLLIMQTQWLSLGIRRLTMPLAPLSWPKTVTIEPLTHDVVIATGESTVVSMAVSQGGHDGLRAFLYLRRGRDVDRVVMRREGNQRYAWTINAVTQDITYWFAAGDDSTKQRPGRIRVVDRPQITSLALTITPPAYASAAEPIELPADQTSCELTTGSTLTARISTNKALTLEDGLPQAWLEDSAGQRHYLEQTLADNVYVGSFQPQQEGAYRVHLVDVDGFENDVSSAVYITLRGDAQPNVAIVRPSETLDVTPQATVAISGTAYDDFGISRIELSGTVADQPFLRAVPSESATAVSVEHDLVVGSLAAHTGQTIEYTLVAYDNRDDPAGGPQRGQSYTMLLRVVSPETFAQVIARELNALAKRLQQAHTLQRRLANDTDQFIQDSDTSDDARLLQLSTQQRGAAEQVAFIRKRVQSLIEQLLSNQIVSGREKKQADLFAGTLLADIEPTMLDAAIELNEARALSAGAARQSRVQHARTEQQRAAELIATLLEALLAWDDYNSAVANLRELVDLQQHISRQTAALQQKTLGLELADMPASLREDLARNAEDQARMTGLIDDAMSSLEESSNKLDRSDDAQALRDIRQTLRRRQISSQSRQATDDIRNNRTGQAQTRQTEIERALTEATTQLNKNRDRQLAELSKRINQIEDVIQFILELQEALAGDTAQAKASALPELAKRQRNLYLNATEAKKLVTQLQQSPDMISLITQVVDGMQAASDALYGNDQPQATQRQATVIDQLRQILAMLEALREQTQAQINKQALFAAQRALRKLRRQQLDINRQTQRLIERLAGKTRKSRKTVRRAKQLAKAQGSAVEEITPVVDKLENAPVYRWVIERTQTAMRDSQTQLQRSELGEELLTVQAKIVRYLDRLIRAIDTAEAMADEQFAEGGGGGGGTPGQDQQQQQKPVPTVAELIVLKEIQSDIRQQTLDMAGQAANGELSEAQLRTIQQLGEEQGQLRQLTAQLTESARRGQ